VVEKLTAKVRYLSSKNRLSCHLKGNCFAVQKMFFSHLRQESAQCSGEHICVVHLQDKVTPSTEGIVAWRVISKQILLRP
jgi:hypothetical protein